jgi:ribonucleotide monophosphatase NagD (HAD superfamily)
MIGDKYTDVEFGKNAGMRSVLLLTGDGRRELLEKRSNWKVKPDFITEDLSSAVDLILELEEND